MDGKELIRRALLGDQQAQRKCTDEEIILPCPLCGGKASVQKDISGKERYHVVCSNVKNASNLVSGLPIWRGRSDDAIKHWNTRPAPPVGRCGECKWYECGKEWYPYCNHPDGLANSVRATDFCCYFEPKED